MQDEHEREQPDDAPGTGEESPDEFETAPPSRQAAGEPPPRVEWPAADADIEAPAGEAAPSEPPQPTSAAEPVAWPDEPEVPASPPAGVEAFGPDTTSDTRAAYGSESQADDTRASEGPPSEDRAGPPPVEAEAYPAAAAANTPAPAAAHSVPAATQVGESTQCPRCGTENRPGIAFCRNCGQRLVAPGISTTVERPGTPEGTQQCPRCGTHNRAGVAFCQNCGANLRAAAVAAGMSGGAAPTGSQGYVPPSVAAAGVPRGAGSRPAAEPAARGGAVLGPIVLLVGAIGIATAWLLPFPFGGVSLWERSFGSSGGYGVAFWNAYANVDGGLLDRAYFGFAAAAPLLVLLLLVLAVAGFLRAAPGVIQVIGLVVALLWAVGLAVAFVLQEVAGSWNGDLVSLLRAISPAGIIFLLAGLIVLIGTITRLARS